MGWGIFKKIKNAFNKVKDFTRKIINKDNVRKVIDTGIKLAPAIGTAIGASQGSGQAGYAIGSSIQNIGNSLGFG